MRTRKLWKGCSVVAWWQLSPRLSRTNSRFGISKKGPRYAITATRVRSCRWDWTVAVWWCVYVTVFMYTTSVTCGWWTPFGILHQMKAAYAVYRWCPTWPFRCRMNAARYRCTMRPICKWKLKSKPMIHRCLHSISRRMEPCWPRLPKGVRKC